MKKRNEDKKKHVECAVLTRRGPLARRFFATLWLNEWRGAGTTFSEVLSIRTNLASFWQPSRIQTARRATVVRCEKHIVQVSSTSTVSGQRIHQVVQALHFDMKSAIPGMAVKIYPR